MSFTGGTRGIASTSNSDLLSAVLIELQILNKNLQQQGAGASTPDDPSVDRQPLTVAGTQPQIADLLAPYNLQNIS